MFLAEILTDVCHCLAQREELKRVQCWVMGRPESPVLPYVASRDLLSPLTRPEPEPEQPTFPRKREEP